MEKANIIRPPLMGIGGGVPWAGFAALGAVYVMWGSTYLGIRFAVRGDGGFPPFALGAVRLACASLLMLGWARFKHGTLGVRARDLGVVALSGMALWLGGNGLVTWAVTRVDSGYAALMMSTMPLWMVVLDAALDRRWPLPRTCMALLLGAAGIFTLSTPQLSGGGVEVWGMLALGAAALSWAAGAVLQVRRQVRLPLSLSAGYQMLAGAVGFGLVSLCRGEPTPDPSIGAWTALAYLVLFGSVVGFGSYVYALRALPRTTVMTHAYVNPVVAVLLGWALAGEILTLWTWAGTALVLAAVAVVFRSRG